GVSCRSSCRAGVPLANRRDKKSKMSCVWKFSQNRIMPCRLEIFHREAKDGIQERARVQNVKIERRELVAEMQFRIVVKRTAAVGAKALSDRPTDNVAHGVEIKMKIERDIVIEPEAFVVNRVAASETQTEGDDPVRFAPDEKARPLRHDLGDTAKKFFRQCFKFHWRPFVDLKIERI